MKNIDTILKALGIEIPEDKAEEFKTEFNANYKTINEVNNLNTKLTNLQTKYDTDIASRDTDLEALKADLEKAGTDKQALADLQTKFADLQTANANAKTEYEAQLAKQQKEFLVKEKIGALKFSSNSAKKAFTNDVLAQDLSVKDGELFGFDDYVAKYKESDADAFVTEEEPPKAEPKPQPSFVTKTKAVPNPEEEEKEIPRVW